MKNLATSEPVRVSSAVLVLGAALIALVAIVFDLQGDVVALIGGVWAAAVGVVDSIVVRNKVTVID